MPQKVFLLFSGANDRAIFALARVFKQCAAPFSVISWRRSDPINRSRYRTQVCAHREDGTLTTDSLRQWVAAARAVHPGARLVLVPSSEYLNSFLLSLDAATLAELKCDLPLVDAATYAELTNKGSSWKWFASRGIPTPRVLGGWRDELPLVAKPYKNVGDDGAVRYPILLQTREELEAFLSLKDHRLYFPQEFIVGTSYYLLTYIARNGQAFASSQINLGQQADGKSIVVARTSQFHQCEVATSALQALTKHRFYGFAMLEFIVGADGPRFVELNPRPWGPLQLCADHNCGIVEAFVGDCLYGDPLHYDHVRQHKPKEARYLWLGGILNDRRNGKRIRWRRSALSSWLNVMRYISSEIYFRKDSWKVFIDALKGG